MRASIPPDLMSCSILTSSALVFLNWKFKPQKVSLGVRSSTATLRAVPPLARRVPTTRTWVVWPERRLVSSSSLPILGYVFISSRPPIALTSMAWAVSRTFWTPYSSHFASTKTTTGNRLPRRFSFIGGCPAVRSSIGKTSVKSLAGFFIPPDPSNFAVRSDGAPGPQGRGAQLGILEKPAEFSRVVIAFVEQNKPFDRGAALLQPFSLDPFDFDCVGAGAAPPAPPRQRN